MVVCGQEEGLSSRKCDRGAYILKPRGHSPLSRNPANNLLFTWSPLVLRFCGHDKYDGRLRRGVDAHE
jgi:hypothetical protein